MLVIGKLELESPVVMAPIAGFSDVAFRHILRRFTNSLMFAEMVSATALVVGAKGSLRRLEAKSNHSPLGVQLLGANPAHFYEAARYVEDQGYDLVDINLGCPKVPGEQLAGAKLMGYPELVARLIRAMRKAVDIPVTVKMRAGLEEGRINCVQIARIAQEEGADGITVHGRTCAQRFSGRCNLDWIAQVVEAVDIPVIANGDIQTPQQAKMVLAKTKASGVMIGRAALGKPWLLAQVERYLLDGEFFPDPSFEEIRQILLDHLDYIQRFLGDIYLRKNMRKVVSTYFKSVPHVRRLRQRVHQISDYFRLREELLSFSLEPV
ncbi:MAG: tRNA dihydrouridine synthase DusB [Planctomycetota bacterium]|nr:MAG: tRNA dihydrouridine synthase DusB [Planctomycetota bacterium]